MTNTPALTDTSGATSHWGTTGPADTYEGSGDEKVSAVSCNPFLLFFFVFCAFFSSIRLFLLINLVPCSFYLVLILPIDGLWQMAGVLTYPWKISFTHSFLVPMFIQVNKRTFASIFYVRKNIRGEQTSAHMQAWNARCDVFPSLEPAIFRVGFSNTTRVRCINMDIERVGCRLRLLVHNIYPSNGCKLKSYWKECVLPYPPAAYT